MPFMAWHAIHGMARLTTGASVAVIVTACVTWRRQVLIGNGALLAPAGDRGGEGKKRKEKERKGKRA